MSFRVTWEQDASDALDKLDATVNQRIVFRVNWLSKNLGTVKPQALSATLKGYYKFRIGSYRVIYSINHEDKELVIRYLGHRREIYQSR